MHRAGEPNPLREYLMLYGIPRIPPHVSYDTPLSEFLPSGDDAGTMEVIPKRVTETICSVLR